MKDFQGSLLIVFGTDIDWLSFFVFFFPCNRFGDRNYLLNCEVKVNSNQIYFPEIPVSSQKASEIQGTKSDLEAHLVQSTPVGSFAMWIESWQFATFNKMPACISESACASIKSTQGRYHTDKPLTLCSTPQWFLDFILAYLYANC